MSFVKLHGTILDSSIWSEPSPTRIVWITMLAMADENGVVPASAGGLARRAVVSRTECDKALETFLGPDSDSRDGTTGERIEKVPGGWLILNHGDYRDRQTKVQAQTAERVRRLRKRQQDKEPGDWVYALRRADGRVHVGFTGTWLRRLQEHEREQGAVAVVGRVNGSIKDERAALLALGAFRVDQSDWLEVSGEAALAAIMAAVTGNRRLTANEIPPSEAEAEAEAEAEEPQETPEVPSEPSSPRGRSGPKPWQEVLGRDEYEPLRGNPVFGSAWEAWIEHASERSTKAKVPAKRQAAVLLNRALKDPAAFITAIEDSIANNWQGVNPDWNGRSGRAAGRKSCTQLAMEKYGDSK